MARWIGGLTEIALMLVALSVVATVLIDQPLPLVGGAVDRILALLDRLGTNGMAGLIAFGILVWLFARRKLA